MFRSSGWGAGTKLMGRCLWRTGSPCEAKYLGISKGRSGREATVQGRYPNYSRLQSHLEGPFTHEFPTCNCAGFLTGVPTQRLHVWRAQWKEDPFWRPRICRARGIHNQIFIPIGPGKSLTIPSQRRLCWTHTAFIGWVRSWGSRMRWVLI
jgi:hypothetical protein